MAGDLYAPPRRNRGVWAAFGAMAVVQALTLCLLVLQRGGAPLPVEESRHGRSLLAVSQLSLPSVAAASASQLLHAFSSHRSSDVWRS